MTIFLILRFFICLTVLELERYKNPKSHVGGALQRCNIFERLIFYIVPFVSDSYILIMCITKIYPNIMPKIDWDNYPKHHIW